MSVIQESFPEPSGLSSNLDPALLDPEMSNYFFGPQSHDPPPYSKIELHGDTYSQHSGLTNDPHHESSWISNYEADFETYLGIPPSSSIPLDQVIDPAVFSSTNVQPQSRIAPLPSHVLEERSVSIAPSMLAKSTNSPIQGGTVWYSNGIAQVGGKKPPHTKYGGEGKGKGQILGKRRPPEVIESAESSPERVLGTRYEKNVETGLDSIKRIKLVFHEDSPKSSRPSSSGMGNPTSDAIDVETSPYASLQTLPQHRHGKKRDILLRQQIQRNVPSVTPPAAIDVDVGSLLPTANDLHLDENTPPPTSTPYSPPKRWIAMEVSIPFKRLDKSQYLAFLAQDAKQVMVKNKITGQVKGISFDWGRGTPTKIGG